MTYTGGEYSTEDLFRELKNQVSAEDVRSFDQYKSLIDVLIEEKKEYGFFVEDEDLEQLRHNLEMRWTEIGSS